MIRPFSSQLGIVRHVLTGKVKPYTRPDTYSAIGKHVVDAAVTVAEEGLEGDEQGDLRVHGGLDKAVHFYPLEHYAYWQNVLGEGHIPAMPGAFGENLSTEGITEQTVCLRDRLKIGSLVLEITQGRQPCWKLNDRFGIPDMALKVQQLLYTGWYATVIQPGKVAAGDEIMLLARPCPAWSIAKLMQALYHSGYDETVLKAMSQLPLVASWQRLIGERLATQQVESWSKRLDGPQNGEKPMTTWFTKNLGDAMLAHPALEQLQGLFRETYGLNGYTEDTAVFTRHESEGRLHCEVKVYFSPATFSIAIAVNATPCRKPIPTDLGLLMGSDAAWPALFPTPKR